MDKNNYYFKYIKYKSKYLELKNLLEKTNLSEKYKYKNMFAKLTGTQIYFDIINEFTKSAELNTPENRQIIKELFFNSLSHFKDPRFYPIIIKIIKDVILLCSSTETLAITLIISTLKDLSNSIEDLKNLGPEYKKDFELMKNFLNNNKKSITKHLNQYSQTNPIINNLIIEIFIKFL